MNINASLSHTRIRALNRKVSSGMAHGFKREKFIFSGMAPFMDFLL